jgi:predicted Zn-dependent protease
MIPEDPYGEIQMLISELPDSAHTIVAKSREFRMSGDIDLALEMLGRALKKDRAPVLLAERADLLLSEQQSSAAAELALEALQSDERRQVGREVLMRALVLGLPEQTGLLARTALSFAEEDPEYCEAMLQAGLDKEPDNITLREQLAQFYAAKHRVDACIRELDELLERAPEHEGAQVMLAAAFIRNGDIPRGKHLIDKARAQGLQSSVLDELERQVEAVVNVIARSKKT